MTAIHRNAQEMKELLDEAIEHMVIWDSNNNALIPPGPYLNTLKLEQRSYCPVLHSSSYRPDILDKPLREKLHRLVRQELEDYIHDDRIQPAVLPSSMHVLGGVPVDALLTHLLKIAIVWGTDQAASAFVDAVDNPHCPFQEMAVIEGLRVRQEVDVYDGVKLVPLPDSTRALPALLPRGIHDSIPLDHLKGATLLMANRWIHPRFAKPDAKQLQLPPPFGFRVAMRSDDAPRSFDPGGLCAALSLVCKVRIRPTIRWCHMAGNELASVCGTSGFTYDNLIHNAPTVELSGKQLEESKILYQELIDFDPKEQERLAVLITRWMESHGPKSTVDQIIDVGVALECLYLDSKQELKYRLAHRAAWYLGDDVAERRDLIGTSSW